MKTDLNEKQRARLSEIAAQVKSNFDSLPIEEILNRIHYITGKNYSQCIEGLKMMLHFGDLKINFLKDADRLENLSRVVDRTFPLMVNLELEFVPSGTFEAKGNVVELKDGPTDDEPEEVEVSEEEAAMVNRIQLAVGSIEPTRIDLSHLNSNF